MLVRPILTFELLALSILVASALYTHYRGRDRLKFRRQVTDHSTFLAPYNSLVYLFSGVPRTPLLRVRGLPLGELRRGGLYAGERRHELRQAPTRLRLRARRCGDGGQNENRQNEAPRAHVRPRNHRS